MKTRFIDDSGIERPIVAVKMSAHQHPSGLKLSDSEAVARHRWNAATFKHRRESASSAGASSESALLTDELSARAYRLMTECPALDFSRAMKETLAKNPNLAGAYSRAHNAQGAHKASGASTTPMGVNFHCAACDTRLTGNDMSDDGRTAVCSACQQPHTLDDATAEALNGTVRVGRKSNPAAMDEAGGDADALEDVEPIQIASRDAHGAPIALRELQQRIRRNQRRRLFEKPVL